MDIHNEVRRENHLDSTQVQFRTSLWCCNTLANGCIAVLTGYLSPGKVLDPIFHTFSRRFRKFVNLENKKKSNVVLVLFGRFCVPERFRTTNDKVSQSDEDIGLPRRRRKVVDPIVQTFFRRFREFVNLLENKKKTNVVLV